MIKLLYTVHDLLRVFRQADFSVLKKLKDKGKGRTLKILCNGSSLNQMSVDNERNVDYMVVNFQIRSEKYLERKPQFYTLADPAFYMTKEAGAVFDKINELNTWEMTLFVCAPKNKKREIASRVTNPLVKLVFFNSNTFRGYKKIAHWLYDRQLAMPQVQNVLVGCIMLGLCMRYDRIELFGVDHDWTRHMFVGEDNLVYQDDPHFYDKEKSKPQPIVNIMHGGETEYPMYLRLSQYARMFQSYWEIKEYIRDTNNPTKIINMCPKSFIDAFEKNCKANPE